MSRILAMTCAGAIAIANVGCSLLSKSDSKADANTVGSSPVEQPTRNWSVGQLERLRDMTTGEPIFVFCRSGDCKVTSKSLAAAAVPSTSSPAAQKPAKPSEPLLIQIAFSYDKSSLDQTAIAMLEANLPKLKVAKALRVVGLADSFDRDNYNLALAKRRAKAVADWIEAKLEGTGRGRRIETDARLIRADKDGSVPQSEPFHGRRVDMTVVILEVQ